MRFNGRGHDLFGITCNMTAKKLSKKTATIEEKSYTPEEVSSLGLLGKMTGRHVRRLCEKEMIDCYNTSTGDRIPRWKIPESAIIAFKAKKK